MTASDREPRQPRERVILGAILLIGFLLRLPGLWQFDAWQDEIYSIFEARDLIHSPFGPGGMELRPLYFLALHPLADSGVIWLLTPKSGRDGHVPPSDINEAAPTAGLSQTSSISAARDWAGARLVTPKSNRSKR